MTCPLEELSSPAVHVVESQQTHTLLLPEYSAAASACLTIAHSQLKHLLSCPRRRGIVYYSSHTSIVERDLLNPEAAPRIIVDLGFHPHCIAATAVASGDNLILFAAGGYNSNIHISLHAFQPTHAHIHTPPKLVWKFIKRLNGPLSSVNHILFTPAALTDDKRSDASSDMRVVVSGNDMFVKFFDIALPMHVRDDARLQPCGAVRLETFVNHISISSNGRTLLCVGDTPNAYLFHISPGPSLTFVPAATYTLPLPPPAAVPAIHPTFQSLACFATAWLGDALRFAIASQEGQLCVWDVRSAQPLYIFWTPFRWNQKGLSIDGSTSHSFDWFENGPDSGIRNVLFSAGQGERELLVWAEEKTNIHVIDSRTFDPATHAIVPFPDLSHLVPPAERVQSPPTDVQGLEDALLRAGFGPHATDELGSAHATAEAEVGTRIERNENTVSRPPVEIAGICFDPSGRWVYVAGDQGIVEWQVRGREYEPGGWYCGVPVEAGTSLVGCGDVKGRSVE